MNFKEFTKFGSLALNIAIFGLFIWYFANNTEIFKEVLRIPLWTIAALVLFKLARVYNSGQFTRATIAVYKEDIPARESFYIALLSSMGNFFGPFLGGAGVRAVYLKKKYKLSYTNFASTISGFYFITFFVYSLIGLMALVLIQLQTGVYSWIMYGVFAAWLISTVILGEVKSVKVLIDYFEKRIKLVRRFLSRLNDVIVGWRLIKDNKPLLRRLNALTFYGFIISGAIVWLEFWAVGVHIGFIPLALYVTLSALSLLVSITPSAIGIREAIFIFSGSLLGLTNAQILQVAVIDRGVTFAVMFATYWALKTHGYIKKN